MKKEGILRLVIRYLIIVLAAFPNLFLFYLIFTPLTVYLIYFILNIFFEVMLIDNIIIFSDFSVEIIKACIAGSAYYLLFALNLAIPRINLEKRLKMLLFGFSSLLIFNVLRILLLILMLYVGYSASIFDLTHKVFWFAINILVVVGIWFLEVWLFDVKEVPVYSDLMPLYKKSLFRKSKSKRKS